MKNISLLLRLAVVTSLLFFFFQRQTMAQPVGIEPYKQIKFDLNSGLFNEKYLPFDVPFIVKGKISPYIDSVFLVFYSPEKETAISEQIKIFEDRSENNKNFINIQYEKFKSESSNIVSSIWSKNIYSGQKITSDSFYVVVPPLEVFRKYKMAIRFNTSSKIYDPSDSLKYFIRSALGSSAINFYKDRLSSLDTKYILKDQDLFNIWIAQLQGDLKNVAINYYSSRGVPSMYLNFKGSIINDDSKFNLFILKYLQLTLINLKSSKSNIEEKKEISTDIFNLISGDKLLTILYLNADSFNLSQKSKQMIYKMIYEPEVYDKINEGRMLYSDNTYLLSSLFEHFKVSETEIYITNILSSINDIYALKRELDLNLIDAPSPKAKKQKKKLKIGDKDIRALTALINMYAESLRANYNVAQEYQGYLSALESKITEINIEFLKQLSINLEIKTPEVSSEFVVRGEWYIMPDIGVASVWYKASPFTNEIIPFFGVNFNFYPVNRQVHYKLIDGISGNKNFLKNASITMGLSAYSLANTLHQRENTFNSPNLSLLTGCGFRLTDALRFNFGCVWLRYYSYNSSLGKDFTIAPIFYTGFSIDIQLQKYLGTFGIKLYPTN